MSMQRWTILYILLRKHRNQSRMIAPHSTSRGGRGRRLSLQKLHSRYHTTSSVMHKDAGKSSKTIFHPGVAEIPNTHPPKSSSAPCTGTGGYLNWSFVQGYRQHSISKTRVGPMPTTDLWWSWWLGQTLEPRSSCVTRDRHIRGAQWSWQIMIVILGRGVPVIKSRLLDPTRWHLTIYTRMHTHR